MSQLSDFDASVFKISKAIIGVVTLTIGTGGSVDVIDGEGTHNRSSENTGYEDSDTRTVVASRLDFEDEYAENIQNYAGKLCKVGDDEWRIGTISGDIGYITLDLVGKDEVA